MRRLPAFLLTAALCLGAARAGAADSARDAHTMTYLPNGNVFIAGGYSGASYLNTTEIMRAGYGGSFFAGPNLSVSRASHTATALGNGCVLVAGGFNGGVLNTADLYDPVTNAVTTVGGMTARYDHTATLLNDGRVLLCGGITTGGAVTATCDLFTPSGTMGGSCGGSFSAGAVSMLQARTNHTAVLLQNNQVWFAGGNPTMGPPPTYTPTTELYTPAPPSGAGSFSSASPLIQARSNHTATMMGDGRILVAGGYDGIDYLANIGILDTTEIYDPVGNDIIPGPTLEARRMMHTSVLSADGSVMLFGGLGNITTTYITPSLTFTSGDINTSNPMAGVTGTSATITAGAVIPNAPLIFNLSQPVVGTISSGTVMLSQPTSVFPWGTATYKDPTTEKLNGTQAVCPPPIGSAPCGYVDIPALAFPNLGGTAFFNSLAVSPGGPASGGSLTTSGNSVSGNVDFTASLAMPSLEGATVTGSITGITGTITSLSYTITVDGASISVPGEGVSDLDVMSWAADATGISGTIVFNPLSGITMEPSIATGGTLVFSPSPLNGTNTNATLSGSTASFPIVINLPTDLNGATVTGTLTIQSGSINQDGAYTGTLTAGTIPFSGVPANGQLSTNVTASGLSGTLTFTTGGNPTSSGASPAGAIISVTGAATITATNLTPTAAATVSLAGTLAYTATNVNIAGDVMMVNQSTVVVDDMIFGQAEYYNPAANSVAFQPPQGYSGASPGIEAFGHTALLLPNNDVFIAGGADCVNDGTCSSVVPVERYTTYLVWTQNFAASGSLNTARALHTSTLLPDGTILVAGGTNGANLLSSAEIFTPGSGSFSPTAGSMSNVRDLHTATELTNGRVLIAGGFSTNAFSTGSISGAEIYYPDTQLFVPTTPMSTARSNHTANLMPDGTVIVVGGFGAGDVITGTVEKFDPEHSTWTALASIPSPRALHTATLLKDGRLMIVGGVNSSGVLGDAWAYSPGPGTWAALASLPGGAVVRSHTATMLPDGSVLIVGGNNGNGETDGSYLYSPVTNSWKTEPPITFARFSHTANLLPDGAVMITGGATKSGAIPTAIELYHVDQSSWVAGNHFSAGPRAFHTMTLSANGNMYAIGGSNGVIGGQGTTLYSASEAGYFTYNPDQYSRNSPPSMRQSTFTVTNGISSLQLSESLTLAGNRFHGGTEASGGGSAAADSSFNSPHFLLQRDDAADFTVDLTTALFLNAAAPPTNVSLAASLPATQALLPDGWYDARVGVNGVYANGTMVQVGPLKPTTMPGSPLFTGTALGVSSIAWTWSSISGVDGYNVYQASSGVFIGTAAATVSPNPYFIQTGLGPNAVSQIAVAGYTTSGDGPKALSPFVSVNATGPLNLIGCGTTNTGDSTTSIPWTWNNTNNGATYSVYNSSTNVQLVTGLSSPQWEDVGLATNTLRSIYVTATANGQTELSPSATCYTQAAVPTPLPPLMTSTETTSVSVNWQSNGNSIGTLYQVYFVSYASTAGVTVTTITAAAQTSNLNSEYITGLTPSTYYSASVAAINGEGVASAPLFAGTTFTLPASPTIQIQGTTPISVSGSWNSNTTSTMTYFELIYSSDNFTTAFSTSIPFSSLYSGSTFTVSGLLTGTSYYFSVIEENPFGQQSPQSAPAEAFTDNGGAPVGSLAGILTAVGSSEFSGNLGNYRYVDLRSPGGAFTADTDVTISSYNISDAGHFACPNAVSGIGGAGVAVYIEDSPALQPTLPLYLTLSYTNAEIGSAAISEVALARYDPVSGTCVALQTSFNTSAKTLLAELNHFSLYELVSVPVYTDASSARVYPNPYHAATDGYVTIDQIPADSRVRVFTLRGEKILDASPNGAGIVTWSADNGAGRPIASGLYLVVVEANGTKKISKLAVIR